MNRPNVLKSKRGIAALGALLVAASISSPTLAHETGAKPFTMGFIIENAYGRTMASGKFDKAIRKITADGHRTPDSFSDQNNLCVAYLKTKATEKARAACDAAIALARSEEGKATKRNNDRSLAVVASRSNLAVALSNRGVLLATTGNAELARQDFVAAVNFQTAFSRKAAANLDRLDRMQESDA